MSTSESAIVIDDDEDSHHARSLTMEQADAVSAYLQILNVSDEQLALDQLTRCGFNLERAISRALDNETNKEASRLCAPHRVESHKNSEMACKSNPPVELAADSEKELELVRSSLQLSAVWKNCYQDAPTPFVDPNFPPTRKSLDGRSEQSASGEEQFVHCHCKLPAAARSVQSDGPNYGRFYLCCGRKNTRRNIRGAAAKEEIVSSCNFFKWDTDGSKGSGYETQWSKLAWHSFLGAEYVLYHKQMAADHVRQGAVGNCWFLSALGVVSEKPYLVKALVPHHQSNEKGCYQINLCLDGEWSPVIVDSHLPVVYAEQDGKPRSGKATLAKHSSRGGVALHGGTISRYPAFCAIPRGQLWPALVEKAYAKAHGSYANLSGGFIAEGLADLTGAPCETVVLDTSSDEKEDLWVKMLSACEAGFLLGVATSRGGNGLVGGHAYSILDVREIHGSLVGAQSKVTDFFANPRKKAKTETASGQENSVRLVRIRNPWGKREWKGAWSVDSEKWTSQLRKKIGHDAWAKDNGTFWMSFDDMLDRFHHMDVCKTRKGWVHQSFKGSFVADEPLRSSRVLYSLKPTQSTWAFITIIQPKKRANTESRYWYCDPQMILLKRMKNGTGAWENETASLRGVSRRNDIEVFLDPKFEYCIVPFSCLPRKRRCSQEFRVACYSSVASAFSPVPREQVDMEAPISSLHKNLLKEGHKTIYRIAAKSVMACIMGMHGCIYFFLINASSTSASSLRLNVEVPDTSVAFGTNGDTHLVSPRSQRILLVVVSSGKTFSATHLSFKYISDTLDQGNTEQDNHHNHGQVGLGAIGRISLAGDRLCSHGNDGSVAPKGGDTVDVSSWAPQLGTRV